MNVYSEADTNTYIETVGTYVHMATDSQCIPVNERENEMERWLRLIAMLYEIWLEHLVVIIFGLIVIYVSLLKDL